MQLIAALPLALLLGSLVSGLPSNPRTNGYAYSGNYSPVEDRGLNENRGLRSEGDLYDSRSYNPNSNANSWDAGRPQNYPQGSPPNSGNNFNRQPSGNSFPPRNPQSNPQGFPLDDGSFNPGGNISPSFPGITAVHGSMNPHLMHRPVVGNPGNPSRYPSGLPSDDSNTPTVMKPAFAGCERHNSPIPAKKTGGRFETQPAPMKDKSHIALFPMTDDNNALYVKVMMPSMQYKAKIQGTNVKLEKCHSTGVACHIEDEASTKSRSLIQPQQWNYMYSQIRDGKITIGIGPATKVMTMTNIPEEELDNAEWLVSSGDGPRSTEADGQGTGGGPFVVEFPCAEYVAQHFSTEPTVDSRTNDDSMNYPGYTAPIVGYSTEPTKTPADELDKEQDHTAAIVVGVVVALIIIALVVAIAISIHRKRTSFKVTESTPLSDQKKTADMAQQSQQSQQQEVDIHDEKH